MTAIPSHLELENYCCIHGILLVILLSDDITLLIQTQYLLVFGVKGETKAAFCLYESKDPKNTYSVQIKKDNNNHRSK